MEGIFSFLDSVYNFLTSGIWEWAQESMMWFIGKIGIWYVETKLTMLQMVWGVAKGLIKELAISDRILAAFNGLPPAAVSMVAWAKIPECINMVASTVLTKFILRFTPF